MLGIINGSDLINQPWNTTFSPYINLFGQGWLLIPVLFITAAIFMRTKDTTVVAMFMLITGVLLFGGSTILAGWGAASFLFLIFAALGFAALIYSIFYGSK